MTLRPFQVALLPSLLFALAGCPSSGDEDSASKDTDTMEDSDPGDTNETDQSTTDTDADTDESAEDTDEDTDPPSAPVTFLSNDFETPAFDEAEVGSQPTDWFIHNTVVGESGRRNGALATPAFTPPSGSVAGYFRMGPVLAGNSAKEQVRHFGEWTVVSAGEVHTLSVQVAKTSEPWPNGGLTLGFHTDGDDGPSQVFADPGTDAGVFTQKTFTYTTTADDVGEWLYMMITVEASDASPVVEVLVDDYLWVRQDP